MYLDECRITQHYVGKLFRLGLFVVRIKDVFTLLIKPVSFIFKKQTSQHYLHNLFLDSGWEQLASLLIKSEFFFKPVSSLNCSLPTPVVSFNCGSDAT